MGRIWLIDLHRCMESLVALRDRCIPVFKIVDVDPLSGNE